MKTYQIKNKIEFCGKQPEFYPNVI